MTTGDVETWAAVGPFHDADSTAAVLGVPASTLPALARQGTILACETSSGKVVYPAWQFGGTGGQVLPGLVPVLQVLARSHATGWLRASWLRSPEVELGGRPPLQVLLAGGEDDLVLLVAGHAAAGWA
jgi:hypothetical protein